MDTVEKILDEMREKVKAHGMPNYLINEIWDWEARLAKIVSPALRDAERYRWLRNETGDDITAPFVCGVHGAPMGDAGWLTGELLDTAIDAAMNGANG